ncbi:MAG: peptidoglycan-associated lipoprotein Pal [Halomonas sp.]|jgi:peptidoglycan-associated lipoprotein|uniref:Peptidoglycan-associated lipoprotein n=1 Tax=Billgrantia tianxiuensis TaxID=2497861 RepID=A0A6I6SI16_9GAMM|nr:MULTISPECIES: peptidoglycan-associated lipoprotein Pal [Halomonas]MCE8031702.1 peptidoglycan-associated lipoprotein Pal [Halomonas sp. MCCC 1A11057]MDX5434289.1 peptidoglycan-associated lipoprotein Pal [Halomonas sp.]QHC50169.1 peptidoglycan-associated lipoprotein Pal [Halomonas tianxiuensis]
MQFKSHARTLAIALSLALIAGCSSTGGSRDGSMDGTRTDGGVGTGVAGSGQVGGTGVSGDRAGQQADGRIPEVRTIYFDFDRDTIRPEFESVLVAHARYLRSNGNARVVLQGHTDERGTREYNMALGERRANSVKRFLEVQGVSPSQLEVVSYGEERLAVRGNGEDAHAQNRRVVFAY